MGSRRALTGWGGTSPTVATVVPVADDDAVGRFVVGTSERGVLARGLGRSYGDAAQNAGGVVLDLTSLDRVLRIDVEDAVVEVEAGASLDPTFRHAANLQRVLDNVMASDHQRQELAAH